MAEQGKTVIGLLGAPGSGKSLVAGEFVRQGAGLIDADALSREATRQPYIQQTLRDWWGQTIFTETGEIDRAAVAARVFNDSEALDALQGLIHPWVKARRATLREQYAADPTVRAIIEDTPLLLEAGLGASCDALVLVDAPYAVRRQRLATHRGWSESDLARRENQQLPLDTKRAHADYVISNAAERTACLSVARRLFSDVLGSRAP